METPTNHYMSELTDLEEAFHERMVQIHEQAKLECNYKASRFIQMVNAEGGLATAKKLLSSDGYSEGLTRLWEEHRLDISMEATILKKPWCALFTEQELVTADKKLKGLEYFVREEIDAV